MKVVRKKTNKKWLVIMLVALLASMACLAVYFNWGMDQIYFSMAARASSEHEQLSSQIESTRLEIAKLPNLVGERENQLLDAQQLLYNEQNKMPCITSISNPVRSIIELANLCEVSALPLRTTAPESTTIDGYRYDSWHIYMSVAGEYENIASFVSTLDGKYLPTANVVSLTLQRNDEDQDDGSSDNYTPSISGTFDLVVYTLSPDYIKESQ